MSEFDPRAALVARKTELEAEAIENRLRYEEVSALLDLFDRKGRQKPGPKPGSVRPMRVVTAADELPLPPASTDEPAA